MIAPTQPFAQAGPIRMTSRPKPAIRIRSLTLVVPCHNEIEAVPPLVESLDRWIDTENSREIAFVFVDDGSTDGTEQVIRDALATARNASLQGATVVRHEQGRGLTAALCTGLAADAAHHESIAWYDSDQTYETTLLSQLAAEVDAGADVACASPYHPGGGVEGVAGWRLLLSKSASLAWRWASGAHQVHTFTSMVRVWRRECLERCAPTRGGFLGVTETLVRAIRQGARVAEVPAVLRRRRVGYSKMLIGRVLIGHTKMLAACVTRRL